MKLTHPTNEIIGDILGDPYRPYEELGSFDYMGTWDGFGAMFDKIKQRCQSINIVMSHQYGFSCTLTIGDGQYVKYVENHPNHRPQTINEALATCIIKAAELGLI